MQSLQITILAIFLFAFTKISAQTDLQPENPPVPLEVEVRNAQGLNFGAFVVNSSATTSISLDPYTGKPSASLDVFPLTTGPAAHYAIFDVYANPGTLIQIQQPVDVTLSGPSGSNVTLSINPSTETNTGASFIIIQDPHPVFVGGTLSLPAGATPPGSYNGQFTLTFINQ